MAHTDLASAVPQVLDLRSWARQARGYVQRHQALCAVAPALAGAFAFAFAGRHCHAIRRFGGFPPRRAQPRRASTAAQLAGLAQPGAGC